MRGVRLLLPMEPGIYQWQDLTTEDFGTIVPETAVAILPMAAIEQHGPHLPVSTDTVICRGILDAAVAAPFEPSGPVILMPVQAVGDSLEHSDFPGTLSLASDTLAEVLYQLGTCVHRTGIRKLLIFNSHGGQPQVIDIAALRLRKDLGMFVAKAHSFLFGVPDGLFTENELAHGFHGGDVETSMMLHLAPDLVRMDKAADFRSAGEAMARENRHLGPEGPHANYAWMARDLNPSGATGDASAANAEKGRQTVDHAAAILRGIIEEVQAAPLPARAGEV